MNHERSLKLCVRALRAGLAGFATILAAAAVSTACLDRPVVPLSPNTTNIVIERIIQDKVDKIDLLFMIDNSLSMADKQTILAAAVPELVKRLVTPICLDEQDQPTGQIYDPVAGCPEGTKAEFEPVDDIHIGVISSSIGGYGGNVCTDEPPGNDRSHLMPFVRADLNSFDNKGFLWWAPDRGGETSQSNLIADFAAHVEAVQENGCGFEASLESWYRFLIDPNPYMTVSADAHFVQTRIGTDDELEKERADFLRPDSLVAIIMLSDENDCSIVTENGFVGAYAASTSLPLGRGSSACLTNPNDVCCHSCSTDPPAGCPPNATDSECLKTDTSFDKVNLRCYNQKQRFGIDFLYPTLRYVNALKLPTICPERWDLNPEECPVAPTPNPLYDNLSQPGVAANRTQSQVFLAGIIGVPWQDIATPETLDDPNALEYLPATTPKDGGPSLSETNGVNRWDWITGDVLNPPDDPLMVESPQVRTGTHPLDPKYDPKGVASTEMANPINGHEWNADATARGDLQFACIFPLVPNKDCSIDTACDCKAADVDADQSPLCQNGTTYTTAQRYAKGYPGLRQLQVLRDYGQNSIVASICPKITDPGNVKYYGYNPAVAAIIDRLKVALGGKCLPRTIALEDPGTPEDASDDYVPCKVLEATYKPGEACACDAPGRMTLGQVEGGAELDQAVKKQLLQDGFCNNRTTLCADWCVCMVKEYEGAADPTCQSLVDSAKQQCLCDPSFAADAGWCYVDPLGPPVGQSIGNAEIVQSCEANEKRLLRFEPAAGAVGYIACKGAPFSGERAGG